MRRHTVVYKWFLRHYFQTVEGHRLEKLSFSLSDSRNKRRCKAWLNSSLKKHFQEDIPIAYILHTQPFCKWSLNIRPPTLIPRWETEEWVSFLAANMFQLLDRQRQGSNENSKVVHLNILDIGCGSGCVGLGLAAILVERSFYHKYLKVVPNVTMVDISESAIKLSQENEACIKKQLLNDCKGISLKESFPSISYHLLDIFSDRIAFKNAFDIVLSNPPYIPSETMSELPKSVLKWEDHNALNGLNKFGTLFHERIIDLLPRLLKPNASDAAIFQMPVAMMEMDGDHQKPVLEKYIKENSRYHHLLLQPKFKRDSADNLRVIELFRMTSLLSE